jgi:hypothetical protein
VAVVPINRENQCGSNGTGGNVAVAVLRELWWINKKERKKEKSDSGSGNVDGVAWGVAVVRWQWCQSIEKINAVRMVPVATWQWQY